MHTLHIMIPRSPTSLLTQLVALDSRSSLSNEPMIAALEQLLEPLGFALQRHPFRDAAGAEKFNLIATLGEGTPALALVGHTDTVPFAPEWTDALTLTPRDGNLYGRGACDTKGFIAATLAAAIRFARAPLRAPLALIFTADEEVGCLGARELLRTAPVRPRRAIVGEPTGLTPIRAHKGYVLVQIEITGREAHSAHPEQGANAIFAASEMITRVESIGRTLERERHPDFDPPFSGINIGQISGGSADNVIAGSCRFSLEWRPLPGQSTERLLEVIGAAARDVSAARGLRVTLASTRADTGFESPATSPLIRRLVERSGRPATTAAYFTEAPCLAALGAETVVFGPGDIGHAHQTHEFVPEAELLECTEILASMIEHYCLEGAD